MISAGFATPPPIVQQRCFLITPNASPLLLAGPIGWPPPSNLRPTYLPQPAAPSSSVHRLAPPTARATNRAAHSRPRSLDRSRSTSLHKREEESLYPDDEDDDGLAKSAWAALLFAIASSSSDRARPRVEFAEGRCCGVRRRDNNSAPRRARRNIETQQQIN